MKNNIILIIAALLLFTSINFAQIRTAKISGSYNAALDFNSDINSIEALGGLAAVEFGVTDNFSVTLEGGYRIYSIDQPEAQNKWGWRFWDVRYSNTVRDNQLQNPALKATVEPVQNLFTIPLSLNLNYNFDLTDNLTFVPGAGGGVYFYTRSLYIIENWSKTLSEDYVFEYSYRNFAPDKKGNPFFYQVALNLEYKLSEIFKIFGGGKYAAIVPTEGSYGYDNFPYENEYGFILGLTFEY